VGTSRWVGVRTPDSPGFSRVVGLPDAAVQEEVRERVRVANSYSGYKFPTKKVIVNLAPANLRKDGGASSRWLVAPEGI
jgi:magnesium chelatase family protein